MDIRDLPIPGHQSLARINARHPWNHNEHFHGWILRNLPARRRAALDIGCGKGVLAGKLATHFAHVTGIDRNEGMAAAATARLRGFPQVSIQRCDFADYSSTGVGGTDLITMVAVLHHLDLHETLARIPPLLAPGGRLLVVGLARADSLADLAFDVVSSAANPIMGMIKHPRAVRLPQPTLDGQPLVPMMNPATTTAEITKAAREHLAGSTVRRRLFFRYTLLWEQPPAGHELPQPTQFPP
jgi:SAM-dependent methyltransferase